MEERLQQLESRLSALEQDKTISNYDSSIFLSIKNLTDFFQVVTAVPSAVPQSFYDSVKFYSTGGTYRLYIYDYTNNAWRYATLT